MCSFKTCVENIRNKCISLIIKSKYLPEVEESKAKFGSSQEINLCSVCCQEASLFSLGIMYSFKNPL